jgi:hypothetical protein
MQHLARPTAVSGLNALKTKTPGKGDVPGGKMPCRAKAPAQGGEAGDDQIV